MQNLGAELDFACNKNSFTVSMSGFDNKMDETLQLVAELFHNPQVDQQRIKKLYENEKASYKLNEMIKR